MTGKFLALSYLFIGCCYSFSTIASNQSDKIDQLVLNAMENFKVPGVAIGIIKDGKITHLKGYGQANIQTKDQVSQDTIFKIASNSKAFTTAALALLVDEGKLRWSDKVTKYLPEFKMKDPWVTKEFNIRDLLTHRSGLGVGAGDLMLWPEPTKFTRKDVIKNLRYLDSVGSFRDEYAYDNLLYIVAGELVAKISGESWERFVETRIFNKLGMNQCFAGGVDTKKHKNLAAPHVMISGSLVLLEVNKINDRINLMAAAGGIKCSAKDLLKWVGMQLNLGVMATGNVLISEKQIKALWKPVTTLPISYSMKVFDKTSYRSYALGWRVSNYHSEHRVSHTGTLGGFMSQIIMLPERNLGIVILTNQQSSSARNSLARGLMNIELNQFSDRSQKLTKNWVNYYVEANKGRKEKNSNKNAQSNILERIIPSNQNNLLGDYNDPWFGEISLKDDGQKTVFSSKMSPRMTGDVFYHNKNKWWVKWHDRSFEADAWMIFSKNKTGKVKMKMRAILPDADFSFDFQDLNFTKH